MVSVSHSSGLEKRMYPLGSSRVNVIFSPPRNMSACFKMAAILRWWTEASAGT